MSLLFINLHAWQIIALIVIGVLLFGTRLPSIARSLGKSVVEFKKGVKDVKDDLNVNVDDDKSPSKSERKNLPDKSDDEPRREVPAEKVEKSEAEKVSS
jgi:sec-independent protein translocase protein TatA